MADKNSLMQYASSLDPAQQAMLQGKQVISETKYDTLILPAVVLANTPFFQAQTPDLAVKNFDGNGYLLNSGKWFLFQTLGVNITNISAAVTGQNIVDVINRCALRIQIDQKVMGTYPVHQLTGFGGAFLSSNVAATVAANPPGGVANFGITNGMPQSQPFRVIPQLIEPQKAFVATLIAPTGTTITLLGTLEIKVSLGGLQFQAIQ